MSLARFCSTSRSRTWTRSCGSRRAELSRLHRRLGATLVYVTHDQTEAMTLGERAAVLRAGVLQQVAAPMQLYREPANRFVADFIGSPGLVPRREGPPAGYRRRALMLTGILVLAGTAVAFVGRGSEAGISRTPGSMDPDIALPRTERNSVAVLPFANLNRDPENEYFSDGITDEILTTLANVGICA